MIKVGVIFGGESVEHEVSIISAVQAMNKMDSEKYEIVPIYITKDGEWYTGDFLKEIETYQDMHLLKKYAKNVILYRKGGSFVLQNKGFFKSVVKEIDIAFPIVHGTNVEDGVLQGYLKTIGIPFVGSDVCAAAIGQDKIFQKQVWGSEGLPIPEYTWFFDSEYEEDSDAVIKKIEKAIKYPVIVKPATLGSSVGINIAHKKEELVKAIEDAIGYDNKILVEEVINNLTEVNISVVGNYDTQDTSVIEEVLSSSELLTYEDKYIGGSKKSGPSKGMASASRKIPAEIGTKLTNEVKEVAVKAFKALNLSGDVRIDFLIDSKKNKVYINDVNTIPGSLAFYLWEPIGKDYTELLDELINIAVKDYKKRINKTHSFETNILSGFTGGLKGAKGCKGVKGVKSLK